MIELAKLSLIISSFITFAVYCSKSVSLRLFRQYGMKDAVGLQITYVFIYSFIYNFLLLILYFYTIIHESDFLKFLFIFFVIIINTAIILSDSKGSIIEIIFRRFVVYTEKETHPKDE